MTEGRTLENDDRLEPIYSKIGGNVCSYRHHLGWTQERLANAIGLSRASIANIEVGRQRLMMHQVIDLARALGVRLADLTGYGDEPESERVKLLRSQLVEARQHGLRLHGIIDDIGSLVGRANAPALRQGNVTS